MRRVFKLSRVATLLALPSFALPFFALVSALFLPAPTHADVDTVWTPTVPPGWEKVEPFDLLGTGDFGFRASLVSSNMDATGDFDGDGRPDTAAVYLNRHTGNLAVFVTLNARAVPRVYKVIEAPANLLARVWISRAIPGEYRSACGYGNGKTCTPAKFRVQYDGIAYFTFEAAAEVVYWNGNGFVDEVVND
jgi:hypothetical protein